MFRTALDVPGNTDDPSTNEEESGDVPGSIFILEDPPRNESLLKKRLM